MTAALVMRRNLGLATLGLALLATAGCVRLGTKPPARLLGIAAETSVEPGKAQSGPAQSALFVEVPDVPKAIDTQRVAVRADATSYAYVKKALWVDTPAHQFQSLLGETIAARTGRLVLDPSQYPAQTGQVLRGELIDFTVEAAHKRVVVTYDATLLAPDGQTIRHQRFSASRPLRRITGDTVASVMSEAANDVAAQVADWIKSDS